MAEMMKLHWSPRSPYVRKVMVVAHELGLAERLECVRTVVGGTVPHLELMRENPLGKIPTLVLTDGTILDDLPVICEYFDTLHDGPKLFPTGPDRLTALRRLALGMACWISRWPRLASAFARRGGRVNRIWHCGRPSCVPVSMHWRVRRMR